MESNNIILFPKTNQNIQHVPEIEEIKQNLDMMKHYHIQETIGTLAPIIFNQLEISGFYNTEDEDNDIKDGAFLIESLRSIMCKFYGIYHPFQEIAENVFSPDAEEAGTLRIADSLNVQLKKQPKTDEKFEIN